MKSNGLGPVRTAVGPGKLFRDYRFRTGLSQQKVAERTGITPGHFSRIESGERLPSREMIFALGGALALDPYQTDRLLLAYGYAPVTPLLDDFCQALLHCEDMEAVQDALAMVTQATSRLLDCEVIRLTLDGTALRRSVTIGEG
jgi:transcriptional regulator with XRE-family HTH domain